MKLPRRFRRNSRARCVRLFALATVMPSDSATSTATYRLTAFREAVAHVQRGGKVMFDVHGAI
jgi:hypothetical protein